MQLVDGPLPEPVAPTKRGVPKIAVELQDREGDAIKLALDAKAGLQLFVDGTLFCDVKAIYFDRESGAVHIEDREPVYEDEEKVEEEEEEADYIEGDFQLREAEQDEKAANLAMVAAQSGVPWFGDEPLLLPDQVEALLIDDELKASRPGVNLLWVEVLKVYESTEDALKAIARNSAIVLPYLNRPRHISGSWEVLLDKMPREEAYEVVTKNPGILACNPAGLKESNAPTIKGMASVVNVVEGSIGWMKLGRFINTGIK